MSNQLVSKTTNLCVVKLSNSWAKAGPMSKANAVGLACVPRLDLDCFESQPDSLRLNQRLPDFLPLTTAATIMFMSPVIVTALSIPLLGEKVGLRRWIGIAIAFAGALIVMRPGTDSLQLSILVVLAAAVTNALYQVFTR